MNTLNKFVLIAGFLTALATAPTSIAGTGTQRVDHRQAKQQNRIGQGIQSGQLTEREVRRLEAQQNRIRLAEGKAKADGVVTRRERARLTRRQNRASRNIYRKKHNLRH